MPTYEVFYTDQSGKHLSTTVEAPTRDEAADIVLDEQDADTIDEINEV